jgi:hypothetical protein
MTVFDNMEVFAPDSPIFAVDGDDFLTGSSGADLFVFSQPIGDDLVYTFDVAADQIDLIGYAGFTSFADVQAHLADDANGNAVLTLDVGQTITLNGVSASALGASNFVFDQTPVTNNTGAMTIGDGAILPLSGVINNTGSIALNSTGSETDLQLIRYGITLQGGGQLTLSDSSGNAIIGTASDVTLTNVDNTISGAGQIGGGQLTLVNGGAIIATGANALVIDTGANVIANAGTLEATGSGGLIVNSAVDNAGLIWANGGDIVFNGSVSGSGDALINGNATIDFGAAASADVNFASDAVGTLILDDTFNFTGTVAGFNGDDHFDLTGIDYAGATVDYVSNVDGTGGTLTVSDGTHTANVTLIGQYNVAGFQVAADNGTGTLVTYDPFHLV